MAANLDTLTAELVPDIELAEAVSHADRQRFENQLMTALENALSVWGGRTRYERNKYETFIGYNFTVGGVQARYFLQGIESRLDFTKPVVAHLDVKAERLGRNELKRFTQRMVDEHTIRYSPRLERVEFSVTLGGAYLRGPRALRELGVPVTKVAVYDGEKFVYRAIGNGPASTE